MDILNKDELFTLSLHLDLADFLNFCKTSRKHEKLNNEVVWRAKIRKDFPNFKHEDLLLELQHKSLQEIYTLLYTVKVWKLEMHVNDFYFKTNIVSFEHDIDLIPECLHLPNLKNLTLEYNKITRIPNNLNLPELRNLSLCRNKITNIPELHFPKLHNLSLTENLIHELPNLNSDSLTTLHLHHNNITSVSEDLNLPSLRILDLNRNKISTIPSNLNLPNLEILRLKENPITAICKIQFPKLSQLEIGPLNSYYTLGRG